MTVRFTPAWPTVFEIGAIIGAFWLFASSRCDCNTTRGPAADTPTAQQTISGASSEPEADAEPAVLRGFATTYWPGDPDGTGRIVGCPAVTLARYGTRDLATARKRAWERDGLHLIAMRRADVPCGAVVTVRGQGREAQAMVADHGPHGQVGPGGAWRSGLHLTPRHRWRGIADLPPALGEIVLPTRWRPASGEVTITMEEP